MEKIHNICMRYETKNCNSIPTCVLNSGLSSEEVIHKPVELKNKRTTIEDFYRPYNNGYKLIKLSTGYYTYQRQNDRKIIDDRYIYATDFNQYGLAIVCTKDYDITYIDQDINYLSSISNTFKKNYGIGFDKIFGFSKSKHPLSKLESVGLGTVFLNANHFIQKFHRYDIQKHEIINNSEKITFSSSSIFSQEGMAVTPKLYLFDCGLYLEKKDMPNNRMELIQELEEKSKGLVSKK